ncbi:hypothetical protein AAMO2058_000809500 [Amorphochlora amoebiformis]
MACRSRADFFSFLLEIQISERKYKERSAGKPKASRGSDDNFDLQVLLDLDEDELDDDWSAVGKKIQSAIALSQSGPKLSKQPLASKAPDKDRKRHRNPAPLPHGRPPMSRTKGVQSDFRGDPNTASTEEVIMFTIPPPNPKRLPQFVHKHEKGNKKQTKHTNTTGSDYSACLNPRTIG